jgi:ribosome recycling factor
MATVNFDINELKRRMQGATQSLKHELGGLRTGRAAASMLEPVQVEAYGSHMPLNQLATVSVPEPRLLSVQVWDKSMVKAVEKAIIDSNLGLSPATEGQDTCGVTASTCSRSSRRTTRFPKTIKSARPMTCKRRPTAQLRRSTSCWRQRKRKSSPSSAANLKFLSVLQRVRYRNFKFKAALGSIGC